MDSSIHRNAPDFCHLFVDEAGTPDIFDAKGRINTGTPGCFRFFFLGMLEVDDPDPLTTALKSLRELLLADPYFASARFAASAEASASLRTATSVSNSADCRALFQR